MDLSSYVRKSQVYEIELFNKSDEPVDYECVILGEGLNGMSNIQVAPNTTYRYEVYFSPLRIFSGKGTISFSNSRQGEVFYELKLNAEEQPPIKMPYMRAELGKSMTKQILLENPINKSVTVTYRINNKENFDILEKKLEIPPVSAQYVNIRYTPSEIDFQNTCDVIFETGEIGNWKFLLFGSGDPPTPFAEQVLMGSLHKEDSGLVNFANPFRSQIMVSLNIKRDEFSADVIEIISKKNNQKIAVQPNSNLQIPFTFYPKEIREYKADIIVELNDKIQWTYPVRIVTESKSVNVDFIFSTTSRKRLEKDIELQQPGLTDVDPSEAFKAEVHPLTQEYSTVLKRWLTLTPVKNHLNSASDSQVYTVKYNPQKPFKAPAEIVVTRASGGRWKFRVMTTSAEPDIDDTIIITSPQNVTSSVQFKLMNSNQKFANDFIAEFSHDSASELTVFPRSGKLEPTSRDGTLFNISFTPVEYGKTKIGKQIIQTDEMYWSFLVKGTFPPYKPPVKVESRIDNWREPSPTKTKKKIDETE